MIHKQPKRQDRPGVDRYGRTELHYAASEGDLPRVQALLAAGAAAGVADYNGWTPLHFAAQAHAAAVCEALLHTGADVDPVDSDGNTPLFRAVFESRGRGEVIAILRHYGADPCRANAHGVSPVSLARGIANYEIAQYFADLES